MFMVSEKKKHVLKEVKGYIDQYAVVGIIDMHGLPAKQLFQIKQKLKGRAVIRVVKKRLMFLALDQSKKPNIKELREKIGKQPAMLFSDANPFELAGTIAKSVSRAAAKAGDRAPKSIMIPAGPTSLPPGPAIGELQRVKIPVGVEGDKIVVKKDTVVAKEGDVITKEMADALAKLGVEPMEISLNLIAIWDEGTVFGKDLLFIPQEHYVEQIKSAHAGAFNLAMNINYLTADTVPLLLSKAHRQAFSLAMAAGIVTKETVSPLLAKANAQAHVLKGLAKEHHHEKPEESAGGS